MPAPFQQAPARATVRIDSEQHTRALSKLLDQVITEVKAWGEMDDLSDLVEAAGGTTELLSPDCEVTHDARGTVVVARPRLALVQLLEVLEVEHG